MGCCVSDHPPAPFSLVPHHHHVSMGIIRGGNSLRMNGGEEQSGCGQDCCFTRGLWETVPLPAQSNDHWPLECTLPVSPVPSTHLASSRCSINVCRVNMGLSGEAVRANGPLISLGVAILSAQHSADFALGSPQVGEAFPKQGPG